MRSYQRGNLARSIALEAALTEDEVRARYAQGVEAGEIVPIGQSLNDDAPLPGSLNSDDEPPAPVEKPVDNLAPLEAESVSMEAQFQDLLYLADSLEKAGGMNQDIALEAQKVIPNFDDGRPLGYYSKTTTATRYKVALEGVHQGVMGLIISGLLLIVSIILLCMESFTGSKGGRVTSFKITTIWSGGKYNALDAKREKAQKVLAAMEKAMPIAHRYDAMIAQTNPDHASTFADLKDNAKVSTSKYFSHFFGGRWSTFGMFLNPGYCGGVTDASNAMGHIAASVQQKAQALQQLITASDMGSVQLDESVHAATELQIGNHTYNISEVTQRLEEESKRLGEAHRDMTPATLIGGMLDAAKSVNLIELFKRLDHLGKEYEKLGKAAEQLGKKLESKNEAQSTGTSVSVRELAPVQRLVLACHKDAAGFRRLSQKLTDFADDWCTESQRMMVMTMDAISRTRTLPGLRDPAGWDLLEHEAVKFGEDKEHDFMRWHH